MWCCVTELGNGSKGLEFHHRDGGFQQAFRGTEVPWCESGRVYSRFIQQYLQLAQLNEGQARSDKKSAV